MKNIFVILIFLFLTSCASLVKDADQKIVINTYPDNATITIRNSRGIVVKKTSSPDFFSLARSDGSYFGAESYTVEISKPNYQTKSLKIESKANNWYKFGNLAFGFILGWLVVDPITGNMYDLYPTNINEILVKRNK